MHRSIRGARLTAPFQSDAADRPPGRHGARHRRSGGRIVEEEGIAAGKGNVGAMEDAVAAAEQGMKDTIPLQARKGRASYLGERSIGHQDPGATSSYLMLNALLEAIRQ